MLPSESVIDAVITWVSVARDDIERDPPRPNAPSKSEFQIMDAVRTPSSGSLAVP